MPGCRLKVRAESLLPEDWHVELNGIDISEALTGLDLHLHVQEVAHAKIEMHVDHLDVDAETLAVLASHVAAQER